MKQLSYKCGHGTQIPSFYKSARFQVSVQINKYNINKQTRNKYDFKKEV